MRAIRQTILAVTILVGATGAASAWDSVKHNPTHPTHTYLTEHAIERANIPEMRRYSRQLIEGANQELHELPVKGTMYGIDLNAWRIRHKGTNEGTGDIRGWWRATLAAYKAGNKEQAYFLLGIMLHFIQDMGVPAHANGVHHQATLREFDNFEAMGALNWKPDFSQINRRDPRHADPSDYYAFSRAWTRADAPDYHDRDAFSKTWITASRDERALMSKRQARTVMVCAWALMSAHRAFTAR